MRSLLAVAAIGLLSVLALWPTPPASTASPPRRQVRFVGAALPGLPQALADGARPLFALDDDDDDDDEHSASADVPDLGRWRVVDVDADDVDAAVAALVAAGASDVDVAPDAVPAVVAADDADDACPIRTPPLDRHQGYATAIAARSVWDVPGGRGQGLAVADVEGQWNGAHEDLPPLSHVAGERMRDAGWRAHGTAVLGVVVAKDNGVGMVGLAPDVRRVVTASLGRIGPARAIHEAAKALAPGDVLIVELHAPGPNARGRGQQGYIAMEYWQPEFEAIQWATAKGVVVVEAAGNGAEDLDAAVYRRRFDRAFRDSGAILVGAGAPEGHDAPARSRLDFSNHGSRVDVQGWGRRVASLDYGDLQSCSKGRAAPDRDYTATFSGTSSASPVVAGAALLVQGVARATRGAALAPRALRALLTETGTPQTSSPRFPVRQHIGPLPHVGRAVAALSGLSGYVPTSSAANSSSSSSSATAAVVLQPLSKRN